MSGNIKPMVTPIPLNVQTVATELRRWHGLKGAIVFQEAAELLETQARSLSETTSSLAFAQSEIVKATDRYQAAVIDRNETEAVRDKLRDVLHRTAVALKGPESELQRHSFHDLPEVAAERCSYAGRLEAAITDALVQLSVTRDELADRMDTKDGPEGEPRPNFEMQRHGEVDIVMATLRGAVLAKGKEL